MIHIVTTDNREFYHVALAQMHAQRKRLFIDDMKWPLQHWAGLEIDQFDTPDAIYLLELDGERLVQSARLLPSLKPHLLGDVFAHLCSAAPPRGEDIWEASRFCPAPDTPKGEARRLLLMRMIAAILETGLLFGVDKVSFVAGAALAPLAKRAGWSVEALGPSARTGRERVSAWAADISSAGLRAVRCTLGASGPVTTYTAPSLLYAA